MKVAILSGDAMPAAIASALASALQASGIEVISEGDDTSTQQATNEAGPAPEDMAKIEGLTDPIIQMRASELTALVNQRDEAVAMAEGERLSHLHCHEGVEEALHTMRVQGWAFANFVNGTKALEKPVKWNDLPDYTREQLMATAAAEVSAFDEVQSA